MEQFQLNYTIPQSPNIPFTSTSEGNTSNISPSSIPPPLARSLSPATIRRKKYLNDHGQRVPEHFLLIFYLLMMYCYYLCIYLDHDSSRRKNASIAKVYIRKIPNILTVLDAESVMIIRMTKDHLLPLQTLFHHPLHHLPLHSLPNHILFFVVQPLLPLIPPLPSPAGLVLLGL